MKASLNQLIPTHCASHLVYEIDTCLGETFCKEMETVLMFVQVSKE